MTWMEILAACVVLLLGVVGVGLTLLTLPGAWLTIAVAVGCNVRQPGLISGSTRVAPPDVYGPDRLEAENRPSRLSSTTVIIAGE